MILSDMVKKLSSIIITALATAMPFTPATAQDSSNHLQCGNVTVVRGEHKTVDISLVNNVKFSAFQCDITIPSDGKYIDNDGKIVTPSSRFADTHQIVEKRLGDNKIRVIAYATDNAPFNDDTSTLFSFTITAQNPNQVSNNETTISNIIFSQVDNTDSEPNCIEHKFNDLSFSTTFTGIDAPSIGETRIYAAGLNIIVISPIETTMTLTNAAGIATQLKVKAGKNTFNVPEPGVYIVGNTKVAVN